MNEKLFSKRGKDLVYKRWKTFETVEDFQAEWAQEKKTWCLHYRHEGVNDVTERWKCRSMRRKGYACPMVLKITFPGDNNMVLLDLLDEQHDHGVKAAEEVSTLTDEAKKFIRDCMKLNLNPKRIHVLLTEKQMPLTPSLAQVQGFVNRCRESPSGGFTDEQLKSYAEGKSEIPADPDATFVVKWNYENNEDFFVLWSTEKLLNKQKHSELLQADATYCLNYLAYPVQIFGYSDCNRRFVPTMLAVGPSEDSDFYGKVLETLKTDIGASPRYILADGSKALTKAARLVFPQALRLMCFAHVFRRVQDRIRGLSETSRDFIIDGLHQLRYARSHVEFTKAATLFMESLPPEADAFREYFDSTWVSSPECHWYEGASPYVNNNNGLESENRSIKANHTLRKRLPFADFITAAERIVAYWSSTTGEEPLKPKVEPEVFKRAYEYSQSRVRVLRSSASPLYIVSPSGKQFDDDAALRQALEKSQAEPRNWDEYCDRRFLVYVVQPSKADKFNHYVCSCPDGSKKRVCKHSAYIMCRQEVGMYEYPPDAKKPAGTALQPVGKKRGRPAKEGRPALAPKQSRYAVT